MISWETWERMKKELEHPETAATPVTKQIVLRQHLQNQMNNGEMRAEVLAEIQKRLGRE